MKYNHTNNIDVINDTNIINEAENSPEAAAEFFANKIEKFISKNKDKDFGRAFSNKIVDDEVFDFTEILDDQADSKDFGNNGNDIYIRLEYNYSLLEEEANALIFGDEESSKPGILYNAKFKDVLSNYDIDDDVEEESVNIYEIYKNIISEAKDEAKDEDDDEDDDEGNDGLPSNISLIFEFDSSEICEEAKNQKSFFGKSKALANKFNTDYITSVNGKLYLKFDDYDEIIISDSVVYKPQRTKSMNPFDPKAEAAKASESSMKLFNGQMKDDNIAHDFGILGLAAKGIFKRIGSAFKNKFAVIQTEEMTIKLNCSLKDNKIKRQNEREITKSRVGKDIEEYFKYDSDLTGLNIKYDDKEKKYIITYKRAIIITFETK